MKIRGLGITVLSIILLVIIPLSTAQSTFTLLDSFMDDTCMGGGASSSLLESKDRLYLLGRQDLAPFNAMVMVIDTTNPSSLSRTGCKNLGFSEPVWNINTGNSNDVDGYAYVSFNSGGAGSGGLFYNLTSDGDLLTETYQVPVATGDFFEINNELVIEGSFPYGCELLTSDVQSIDLETLSNGVVITMSTGSECRGVSEIWTGGGNTNMIMYNADGNISLANLRTANIDDTIVTGSATGNTVRDGLSLFNNKYILVITGGVMRLIEYDDTSSTITEIGNTSGFIDAPSGVEFISNDTFLIVGHNNTDDELLLVEFSWNPAGSITQLQIFHTGFTSTGSAGSRSLDYEYPYLYVQHNNASPYSNAELISYEFIPTGLQAGVNKKPAFTNYVVDNAFPSTTQTSTFTYVIANPETASVGERISQIEVCSIAEPIILRSETFDDSFNFTNFCGLSSSIGSKNGLDFALGLDLTTCNDDNLILTQTSNGNTLVSFDMYATTNGTAIFELLEFDGSVIQEITINYNNNSQWTLTDETNIIFENLTAQKSGVDVPIRFFIQLSPNTPNINLVGRVYYGTNYFSQTTSNEINNVFCDSSEFCYIGDYSSDAGFINDYFALRIVNSTGNLALDNYRVESVEEYPVYTGTRTLNGEFTCNYTQQGVFNARNYLSDVTYGHNYLYHEDIEIIVTLVGLPGAGATTINQSIAQSITDIANSAGLSDDTSRQLVAWLIILVTVFGFIWLGSMAGDKVYHITGLTMGAVEFALFLTLGWIPIFWLVLGVIITAGIIAMGARNVVSGAGG